jgi:hypothetical protein
MDRLAYHLAKVVGSWCRVIRENPASWGTETSAEVFVGPPGG